MHAISRMVLSYLSAADAQLIARSPRSTAAGVLWMVMNRIAPHAAYRARLGWAATTLPSLAAACGLAGSTIGARSRLVQASLDDTELPWHHHLHSSERRSILDVQRDVAEFRDRGYR